MSVCRATLKKKGTPCTYQAKKDGYCMVHHHIHHTPAALYDCVCAICLDEVGQGEDRSTLECNHTFHKTCVILWLSRNQSCPHCRAAVNSGTVRRIVGPVVQTPLRQPIPTRQVPPPLPPRQPRQPGQSRAPGQPRRLDWSGVVDVIDMFDVMVMTLATATDLFGRLTLS